MAKQKPTKTPVKGPRAKPLYKPVPDVAARDMPPTTLNRVPTAAAMAYTPEQEALVACGQQASLIQEKPEARQAVQVMIALRRAYAVVHRELSTACEQLQEKAVSKGETPRPELLDFMAQYAAYEASKPFSEHTLMAQITQEVMPWLARTVDRHSASDDGDERLAKDKAEKERRAAPITIGVPHTFGEPAELYRGTEANAGWRGLVLVGWKPAVLWLIDKIVAHVRDQGKEEGSEPTRISRIPASEAEARKGCCDTPKKFHAMLSSLPVEPPGPCDLIVCDDLGAAYTQGYTGRPAGARAGDAYRQFYKLCKAAGAAFIGGVLLPTRDVSDVEGAMYAQLQTHAHLRAVTIEADDQTAFCRIIVGRHAAVFTVSDEELEPPTKILTAGDL